VHAGRRSVTQEIAAELAQHVSDDALSVREVDILRRIAVGIGNRDIGSELGIGEETVKSHVKRLLAKLGANDRTHAVTIAIRRGILEL